MGNATIKKERPILFSAPMVLAILEGRKTMTRRIIKDQPKIDEQTGDWLWIDTADMQRVRPISEYIDVKSAHCKYGKPGDRLWVRETFFVDGPFIQYRADHPDAPNETTWKPSIFMPRAASRILLEITDVRAERLWDISEEDAAAEGVQKAFGPNWVNYVENNYTCESAATSFLSLFASINGRESLSENPLVWVITFKKIEP